MSAGDEAVVPRVHGRLDLRFELGDDGETVLAEQRQHPPLQVVRPFTQVDGAALVHLHNVSGGVLGGDILETRLRIGARARVQVTTTGATRVYTGRRRSSGAPRLLNDATNAAVQRTSIEVAENALLEYLPDPVIPFSGANFEQHTRIELANGAGLFWWETLAPGRAARGEVFEYARLRWDVDIIAAGRPIARERTIVEPIFRSVSSPARIGPYRYLTTFYICRVGEPPSVWQTLEIELSALTRQLSEPGSDIWGASSLVRDGIAVRNLSVRGHRIQAGLFAFWRAARLRLYESEACPPRKVY